LRNCVSESLLPRILKNDMVAMLRHVPPPPWECLEVLQNSKEILRISK